MVLALSHRDFMHAMPANNPGAEAYAFAVAKGLEGIVAKRVGSPYIARRSDNWRKIKTPAGWNASGLGSSASTDGCGGSVSPAPEWNCPRFPYPRCRESPYRPLRLGTLHYADYMRGTPMTKREQIVGIRETSKLDVQIDAEMRKRSDDVLRTLQPEVALNLPAVKVSPVPRKEQ